MDKMKLSGKFKIQHIRDNVIIGEYEIPNGVTVEGKNYLLDAGFNDGTKITAWYCGIIDSITALSEDDTMSSHTGWTEYTDYDESARQTWGSGAASDKTITNAVVMQFTINDSGGATIRGLFITSDSTKNGTSGTLWSTAQFDNPVAVSDNDELKIIYTLGA